MDKKSKTFIDDYFGLKDPEKEVLKRDNKRLRMIIGELKKKYKIPTEVIEKLNENPKPQPRKKK